MNTQRVLIVLGLTGGLCCAATAPAVETAKVGEIQRPIITLTPEERAAADQFEAKLKDYIADHRKAEAALPHLSKDSTPQEIDKNQRALGTQLAAERAGAKQGDFFTPPMEGLVRRTLQAVLAGPDAKTIKASIMDENPGVPNLKINDRYPDNIPLSTMPPQVLEPLPKLDEEMEYRFLGKHLVLLDTHAHLVVDFTGNVLP
jgi:hypothetical protein